MRWLLPILLVGCATQTDPAGSGTRRRCADLEGKTFASLAPGECGLGSNGPTSCTWHLMFTAANDATTLFNWQHSDVEESGDVYCAGSAVVDVGSAGTRGSYHMGTDHLVWEGVEYAPY